MTQVELNKLILEETKGLPENILSEILDFVLFLKQKVSKKSYDNEGFELKIQEELIDLHSTELTHLEEEFRNYREIYPREE